MAKREFTSEELKHAEEWLCKNLFATPDAQYGLAVTHANGWILDGEKQGWKLSEILAAYKAEAAHV